MAMQLNAKIRKALVEFLVTKYYTSQSIAGTVPAQNAQPGINRAQSTMSILTKGGVNTVDGIRFKFRPGVQFGELK